MPFVRQSINEQHQIFKIKLALNDRYNGMAARFIIPLRKSGKIFKCVMVISNAQIL